MSLLCRRVSPIKWFGVILFAVLPGLPSLHAQDTARFVGIGYLAGGTTSFARDVSANGTVVIGFGHRVTPTGSSSVFRWTEAEGVAQLPDYPGATTHMATGLSGDGSVAVGTAGAAAKALRWAGGSVLALPLLPVNPPLVESGSTGGISYDGSIIVGTGTNDLGQYEAVMWHGGIHNLGHLPGGNSSTGKNVSPDGTVIVGSDRLYYAPNQPYGVAYRSIGGGGLQSLGTGGYYGSQATAASNGGAVIVGYLSILNPPSGAAARWTAAGGWEVLRGTTGSSVAYDVSADGSMIVGSMDGQTKAFLWEEHTGARDLKMVLENEYHLDLSGWTLTSARAVDSTGSVIVGDGLHNGTSEGWWVRLSVHITKPRRDSLWIAGKQDTIKWIGGKKDQILIVDYSLDSGKTFLLLDFVGSADTGMYVWTPPADLISKKCFIRIADYNDQTKADTSELFRIKPYILTRDSSGQYEPYRPEEDRWGFANSPTHLWPSTWYQQFDYRGIDPFTNSSYSLWQGGYVFFWATSADYPDWVSWVNAFGVDACYVSTALSIYSPTAVLRWEAHKYPWQGSCFGLATSNALSFSYKGQFHTTYGSFPVSANPITAPSDSGAKTVIHELYTHQFGSPHREHRRNTRGSRTPTETLNDLKQMLTDDNAAVRTLCLENNGGSGAHGILAYGIDKDAIVPDVYYVRVYDNSYPTSTARVWINTSANGGKGSWSYANLPGWGGEKYLYLYDPAVDYFDHPALPKPGIPQFPFALGASELQIFTPVSASARIIDNAGKVTGFYDDTIHEDIPGSTPLIPVNGSETPPYGYALPAGTYSVLMDSLTTDTVKTFFFTGNRTVSYRRTGARPDQTDRLFFDGGVAVANPDQQTKTISLTGVINETTREKLFTLNSIELSQNDSVRIEQPDSNTVKLISHGTAKDYDIELNYVTGSGIGKFGTENIPLSANTTHSIAPDWENVSTGTLRILVDTGNDGTIDDTLSLQNRLTGTGSREEPVIPEEYRLEQNYPNPFNPTTTIRYALRQQSHVSLTIHNTLGQLVATIVRGEQEAGHYEAQFDASGLASGVYFYRLHAGVFTATKKFMVLR